MGMFDGPRDNTIKTLKVEQSLERLLEKVKLYLAKNTPSAVWNPLYAQALGWNSLGIVKGPSFVRGLAYYSSGHIELRLNGSTMWMDNSGSLSELNGREDLTPTGVLAHELGHQFEWSLRRRGGANGLAVLKEFAEIKKHTAVSDYGNTDIMEDWAESYRLFLLNPQLLKKLSDPRYNVLVKADRVCQAYSGFKHGIRPSKPDQSVGLARLQEIPTQRTAS
jgi:hypothetical protein